MVARQAPERPAREGLLLLNETALRERQADDGDRGERELGPTAGHEHENPQDQRDQDQDLIDGHKASFMPPFSAALPGVCPLVAELAQQAVDGRKTRDEQPRLHAEPDP